MKNEPLVEAERSIVAMALDDPKCYIEAGLRPEHFFDIKLQLVWQAIGYLSKNDGSFDAVAVGDLLSRWGKLEA